VPGPKGPILLGGSPCFPRKTEADRARDPLIRSRHARRAADRRR
jgi:hypothetical protein